MLGNAVIISSDSTNLFDSTNLQCCEAVSKVSYHLNCSCGHSPSQAWCIHVFKNTLQGMPSFEACHASSHSLAVMHSVTLYKIYIERARERYVKWASNQDRLNSRLFSQVVELPKEKPEEALQLFADVTNLQVVVMGGDGTAGWILGCIDKLQENRPNWAPPPVVVIPMGTGMPTELTYGRPSISE